LHDRTTQIRTLIETLDLLCNAFGRERFGRVWPKMLPQMQKWLAKGLRERKLDS